MKNEYDKYYQTENLFGNPYPELMNFYSKLDRKGELLDLGCGQGRDSIPLAKLGFSVTGIDNSEVGIEQLNKIAEKENLSIKGFVDDIYSYSDFDKFEFILLDSMFHFGKKEREKEVSFLNRLIEESNPNTLITICIQKTGKKLEILNAIISNKKNLVVVNQTDLIYKFEDKESNHISETKYEMITIKKV
ncbi:MAG: class I SAM-dependent methyltransferase [Saprospiraceae bacterium]